MMCSITNPLSCPGDFAGKVVGGTTDAIAGSAIDKFAEAVSHAVGEAVKAMATMWVKIPTVGLGDGETASKLQDNLYWYMGFAAVLSVIIAGGRMAWIGRADPARDLLASLIKLVVVVGAGLAVVRLAVESGDAFAAWLIDNSAGDGFEKRMTAMLASITTIGGPLGAVLVIVVGLILVLASIVQIILMIARSGMLVLLAGVLPISAAATNTEWGKQWFSKTTGWMIAFILYKPAAALVYAAAFELFGESKGLTGALTGMTMMILAVAALPALMKLCVPLVGGLAAGGAGAGGGAMAAAAMAGSSHMPSGARDVPSQSSTGSVGMAGGGSPNSGNPSGGSPSGSSGGGSSGGGPSGAKTANTGGGGAASTAATGAAAGAAGPAGAGVQAARATKGVMDQTSSSARGAVGDDNDGGPDGSQ